MKTCITCCNYWFQLILSFPIKFWGVFSNANPFSDTNSLSYLLSHNQKTPGEHRAAGSTITQQVLYWLFISCSCNQPKRILQKAATCLTFPKHVSQILLALYLQRNSSSIRTIVAQLQTSCCTPGHPRHVMFTVCTSITCQQVHTARLKHFCRHRLSCAACKQRVSLSWTGAFWKMLHIHLQATYSVQDQSYAPCKHRTHRARTNYLYSTTHCTSTMLHTPSELCLGNSRWKYGSCHLAGWRFTALATKRDRCATAYCKRPHLPSSRLPDKPGNKATLSLHLDHFLENFLLFAEPSPLNLLLSASC